MYQRILIAVILLFLATTTSFAQAPAVPDGEPGFRLRTPIAGQHFGPGQFLTLSFSAEGINLDPGSLIKVEYQIVGDAKWHLIAEGLYAAETFEWAPDFKDDRELSIRATAIDDQGNALESVVTGVVVSGLPAQAVTVADPFPGFKPKPAPVVTAEPTPTKDAPAPEKSGSDPTPKDANGDNKPLIIGAIAGAIVAIVVVVFMRRRKSGAA